MSGANRSLHFVDVLPAMPTGAHRFVNNIFIKHFRKCNWFDKFHSDKPILTRIAGTVTV